MGRLSSFLTALFLCLALSAAVQGRYGVEKLTVRFFSKAPIEDIEAVSTGLKGIVDFDARTFAFRLPIKSFAFPSALMQKHFNENYLESDKYPNAAFKGRLQGDVNPAVDGVYPATAVGELTIHGVTTARTIPCTVTVKGGACTVASKFRAKLADHHIEVPTLMFEKIAEEVEITVDGSLGRL